MNSRRESFTNDAMIFSMPLRRLLYKVVKKEKKKRKIKIE